MKTANSKTIESEAKTWLLLMNSGNATDDDFMNFDKWLSASPHHKEEYQRLESLWLELDDIGDIVLQKYAADISRREQGTPFLSSLFNRLPRSRSSEGIVVLGLACTLIMTLGIYLFLSPDKLRQDTSDISTALVMDVYSSGIGEILSINLPDGSQVELGPKSRLEVNFTDSSRTIRLLWGEAYFNVTKDHNRPFIVISGNGSIKAIGTEFEIRKGVRQTFVTVYEGIVEVSAISTRTNQPMPSASLTATQQVSYSLPGPMSDIKSIDLTMQSGWRSGRMIFNNQPLIEVVADLNRYGVKQINLADDRLFDIKVNGVFNMGESEAVINAIEKTLPARAIRDSSDNITLLYIESAEQQQ